MEKIVFTNGCFDLVHPGHVELLKKARLLGTKLIVGLNSDESVRAIKGKERPFLDENSRASILREFRFVDEVYIFNENTPERLIKEIKPDVLVKGGDWSPQQIVGADFVLGNGGEVHSIPFESDFSSSKIVEKIKLSENQPKNISLKITNETDLIKNSLKAHVEMFENLLAEEIFNILKCAEMIYETFAAGNKVLFCDNGGSVAGSQQLAAEFIGRYETERRALPAIALTADTSALTALASDCTFDRVYSRQIEALAREGDLLIAISTSDKSPNVISAVMKARQMGCRTISMTGKEGKKLASLCDANISISVKGTARVQGAHITVGHIWCEIVDEKIKKSEESLNG